MVKTIPCIACDGHGVVSKFTDNSAWVETCDICKGAGYVEVPMTKADRIRAMSDEELADAFNVLYRKLCDGTLGDLSVLFCDGKNHCITKRGNIRCSDKKEKACVLRWLQQPVEED